jgi:hypothetical protein
VHATGDRDREIATGSDLAGHADFGYAAVSLDRDRGEWDNSFMDLELWGSRSLQDIVYGYMPAQVLRVAAVLGIADELAGGRRTVVELARATESDAPSLRRVLRGLTCLGVVAEPEPDMFELAAGGQQLRSDRPDSIKAAVLLFTSHEMWLSWGRLEYGVRTGKIAWDDVVGMSVFEFMDRHPEQSATFNAAMSDRTRTVSPRIAGSYDFSRFDTLVDLGGGNGTLMAAILATAPALRGVLFDQPAGMADAAENLRSAGVAGRCEIVAGDFFVAMPEDADAYLLKSVIHNWDNERAVSILRNCRAAMRDDGTLLVIERLLPSRIASPTASRVVFSDINMLVNTHGKERTEEEFRSLYSAAGFELTEIVRTSEDLTGYQILVGRPNWRPKG